MRAGARRLRGRTTSCRRKGSPKKEKNFGGSPHFVAMNRTLSTSLTPARRHESIWQTSIASAWKSCLNTIRLCACSPVATPIPCGFSARRMAACPRISSGAVGSSMNLKTTATRSTSVQTLPRPSRGCQRKQKEDGCAPGLDLGERRNIVDRLRHVPYLVRIDHEHRAGRTCVLPGEGGAAWETRRLGITR